MNSSLSTYTYACTRLGGMKNVKNVKKPKPLRSFTFFMFFTLSGRTHACGPRGVRLAASGRAGPPQPSPSRVIATRDLSLVGALSNSLTVPLTP